MRRTSRKVRGFTLVDLMIGVTIMSILASIGMTSYRMYVARAKRPEAVIMFKALADAQRAHMIFSGQYTDSYDELSLVLEGAIRVSENEIQGHYYNYRLSQPFGVNSWYCVATGNIDGDAFPDVITAQNIN